MLSCSGLEPRVQGDRGGEGNVFSKVMGDRREGDHIGDEGSGYEGQGSKHIVPISGGFGLVRGTVIREVEEEVWFVRDLLLG